MRVSVVQAAASGSGNTRSPADRHPSQPMSAKMSTTRPKSIIFSPGSSQLLSPRCTCHSLPACISRRNGASQDRSSWHKLDDVSIPLGLPGSQGLAHAQAQSDSGYVNVTSGLFGRLAQDISTGS